MIRGIDPGELLVLWNIAEEAGSSAFEFYDNRYLRDRYDNKSIGKFDISTADCLVPSIFLVNGGEVSEKLDPDFVLGGHGYAYEFIPEDEVWIDAAYDSRQRKYVIFHELVEWWLMKRRGYTYEIAHRIANEEERKVRRQLKSESTVRMSTNAKQLIEALTGPSSVLKHGGRSVVPGDKFTTASSDVFDYNNKEYLPTGAVLSYHGSGLSGHYFVRMDVKKSSLVRIYSDDFKRYLRRYR